MMPRRQCVKAVLAALGVLTASQRGRVHAASPGLKMPEDVPTRTVDFETRGLDGWTTVAGQWAVEEMAGAPSGRKVLVQHATQNEFNVIVAPGSYADVEVSM